MRYKEQYYYDFQETGVFRSSVEPMLKDDVGACVPGRKTAAPVALVISASGHSGVAVSAPEDVAGVDSGVSVGRRPLLAADLSTDAAVGFLSPVSLQLQTKPDTRYCVRTHSHTHARAHSYSAFTYVR